MGKSTRVEQGCRDCKKCTNSGVANLGRNSSRATMGLMTMGMSEVGMRALSKKCRICNHQLSLHKSEEARTPQPAVTFVMPAPASPAAPAPALPVISGPPAGWYADPRGFAPLRWWNGVDWTEHTTAAVPQ